MISRALLARNTVLNAVAQAAPLAVGVMSVPFIIRGLGVERFGLLGIAWAVLGYFTFLDLGMSRAATRFVADAIGRDAHTEIPAFVWAAVSVQTVIALFAATAWFVVAPWLALGALNVPDSMAREAVATMQILALAIPVALMAASFRGVLEAAQRFGILTAVTLPASTLNFVIPVVGAWSGWSLPVIVAGLIAGRAVTLIAYVVTASQLYPGLRARPRTTRRAVRLILPFGVWTGVSNLMSPIMGNLDRLFVGVFAGMGAVGYYTAPQEIVFRLRVAPASLAATLFPAFASLQASTDTSTARAYYGESIRSILMMLAPLTLAVVLLAPELLDLWLGPAFRDTSSTALRILTVGVLVNAIAYVPYAYLHSINRPDLPAKFHILELPVFLALVWLLIPRWGVSGAAAVWTLRVGMDTALLLAASARLGRAGLDEGRFGHLMGLASVGVFFGLAFTFVPAATSPSRYAVAAVLTAAFTWIAWMMLLDAGERKRVRAFAQRALYGS